MTKLFDTLVTESRGLKVIRRTILTLAVIHFSLAAVSGYRAWVQVKNIQIRTTDETLGPGSSIQVYAVTSARNAVTISLEAVQNGATRSLASVTVPGNKNFYDPRSARERFVVVLTPEILTKLKEGQVVLRATGLGRSQFLRVPPPTVVERESAISWTRAEVAENNNAPDDTMCIAAKIGLPCR